MDFFIPAMVEKIRAAAYKVPEAAARQYYMNQVNPEAFIHAIA
jgi:hypothetical protein